MLRKLADQLIDLRFCAYVDAACGLVEDKDIRLGQQPFGDDYLLLVATGKLGHRLVCVAHLDPQIIRIFADQFIFFLCIDEQTFADLF
ncbi:hypothetical protein SDC9_190062 [bioreactor metagenome]|uniref:Uncharacterized protein n=1 Tax=bioreactor metagenome TaxID=1076179 RepID=A0A645HTX1_9ZZZZ